VKWGNVNRGKRERRKNDWGHTFFDRGEECVQDGENRSARRRGRESTETAFSGEEKKDISRGRFGKIPSGKEKKGKRGIKDKIENTQGGGR